MKDTRTMRESPAVFWVRSFGAGSLGIVLRPRGGGWLPDDIGRMRTAGIDMLVSMLTAEEQAKFDLITEAECCHAQGIEYVSAPIPDLGVPTDSASFEKTIEKLTLALSRGQSVAVHCRQSVGRSGLAACSVLLAMGMSLDEAIAVVSQARGVQVPETLEQRVWLEQNAVRLSGLATKSTNREQRLT